MCYSKQVEGGRRGKKGLRVFVTGATGFVGKHLVDALLDNGYRVRCLVRPGSEQRLAKTGCGTLAGRYIGSGSRLAKGLEDCQAVIHLVGIIREFPRQGLPLEGCTFRLPFK